MSDFIDSQLEAFDEVIDLLGSTVTHKGTSYSAIVNSIRTSTKPQDGGLLGEIDSIVLVRKSDFAAAPVAGDRLTIDGKTVRIDTVDMDEVAYELRCVTAAK